MNNKVQKQRTFQIKTQEELIKFNKESTKMCWEGLIKEDHMVVLDTCGTEQSKGFWWTGELMNQTYGLTGDDAYKNDLVFFAIDKYEGLAINYGARWLDDIVDNNKKN